MNGGKNYAGQDRIAIRDTLNKRVTELAAAKDLKTKGEHQQRRKCSQCGDSYLGQANSSTCGDKCRQAKSRG